MSVWDRQDEEWSRDWLVHEGVTPEQLAQMSALLDALVRENEAQNLVANGTLPFAWSRHLVDSVQLLRHVPRGTITDWVDLGTGAGFPGLACAIALPSVEFTLIEQRTLRTEWLQRQVDALSLANVVVETANAGLITDRKFDVISARAFAPLPRLLKLSAAFSTPATTWVLPKGRSAKQELAELKGWRHMFHVEQSVTDPQSGIITGQLLGCS